MIHPPSKVGRRPPVFLALSALALAVGASSAVPAQAASNAFQVAVTSAQSAPVAPSRPMLTARVSRWQGESLKKRKGPEGFDLAFRLVGHRFDGTFNIEGLPQNVPEGEGFDAHIKLTNIGGKKDITVSTVSVTGDGLTLQANLVAKKADPKTSVTIATFKVPPQSSAGSSYQITVVLSNGDKHVAKLTFSRLS